MKKINAGIAALALCVRVLLVREWPGTLHYEPPKVPPAYAERLADRCGLVVFAAAAKGSMPERFGLAVWLRILGRSILACGVVHPDDLRDDEIQRIRDALDDHPLATLSGEPWQLCTLSEFCDPFHGELYAVTYQGAGFLIGADLGRTLGLLAEHVVERHGRNEGCFEVWPVGTGKLHSRNRIKRRSSHRPPLWLTARRVGWMGGFAPCAKGRGKWVRGRVWRGAALDVSSAAYALDTDRSASFGEHRTSFGLSAVELPLTVEVDARGVDEVACAATAIHELAIAVDAAMARWFTSPQDRAEERGRMDLCRTASPGALATQLLLRAGVAPPLVQFGLLDGEAAP